MYFTSYSEIGKGVQSKRKKEAAKWNKTAYIYGILFVWTVIV